MHETTFQTETSIGALNAFCATESGAHPPPSDLTSLSSPVSSPVAPLSAFLGHSLGCWAATMKVSISFVKPGPLGSYAVSFLPILDRSSALAGLGPHPAQRDSPFRHPTQRGSIPIWSPNLTRFRLLFPRRITSVWMCLSSAKEHHGLRASPTATGSTSRIAPRPHLDSSTRYIN